MAIKRLGFEGKILYGAAGATATTEITNSRDIAYNFDYDKGDTTGRDSGSPPVETGRVSVRKVTITFTMLNKASDSTLDALLTAAYAGTAVALRLRDYSAGKGYDGDVILKVNQSMPLRGEQTYDFTAEPTEENRAPSLYV